MNTTKAAAIFLVATVSAASWAADVTAIPASTQSGITRAQVGHELQHAIANGEIKHGDLVDFHELVAPSAPRTALVDNREQQARTAKSEVAAARPADQKTGITVNTASSDR